VAGGGPGWREVALLRGFGGSRGQDSPVCVGRLRDVWALIGHKRPVRRTVELPPRPRAIPREMPEAEDMEGSRARCG